VRVLDRDELLRQLVVLDVGDRRCGLDVVATVVLGQLVDQREVFLESRN